MLKARLISLQKEGDISDFRYISADEVLQIFAKKHPKKFSFLKKNSIEGNPLAAAFEMVPKNKSVEELTKIFLGNDFVGIIDVSKINLVKDTLLEVIR